jgi:hypothetical protein
VDFGEVFSNDDRGEICRIYLFSLQQLFMRVLLPLELPKLRPTGARSSNSVLSLVLTLDLVHIWPSRLVEHAQASPLKTLDFKR